MGVIRDRKRLARLTGNQHQKDEAGKKRGKSSKK